MNDSDFSPLARLKKYRHIGLVGHPKSGKSTFAEALVSFYGGVVIDDGMILRKAVPYLIGCDKEDCFTQDGKAKSYRVGDRYETVREALGELGNWMESRYGPHIMPIRAMDIAAELYPEAPFYIYPSVRKTQGWAYREAGGFIIEIDNPSVGPSGNQFDTWEQDSVDFTLKNDGDIEALWEQAFRMPYSI